MTIQMALCILKAATTLTTGTVAILNFYINVEITNFINKGDYKL